MKALDIKDLYILIFESFKKTDIKLAEFYFNQSIEGTSPNINHLAYYFMKVKRDDLVNYLFSPGFAAQKPDINRITIYYLRLGYIEKAEKLFKEGKNGQLPDISTVAFGYIISKDCKRKIAMEIVTKGFHNSKVDINLVVAAFLIAKNPKYEDQINIFDYFKEAIGGQLPSIDVVTMHCAAHSKDIIVKQLIKESINGQKADVNYAIAGFIMSTQWDKARSYYQDAKKDNLLNLDIIKYLCKQNDPEAILKTFLENHNGATSTIQQPFSQRNSSSLPSSNTQLALS